MNNITLKLNADDLILSALREDIPSEDVTTNSVMKDYEEGTCDLIAKEDGILCGTEVFKRVFILLDENTEVVFSDGIHDGSAVKKGDLLARLKGDIRVLLSGERTALNYLQRMSGISTYTRRCVPRHDLHADPAPAEVPGSGRRCRGIPAGHNLQLSDSSIRHSGNTHLHC